MTAPADLQAAEFVGTLWAAISTAGGPHQPAAAGHQHYASAYGVSWLAALPLPTGAHRPPGQPVALLDDRDHEFERHYDGQALTDAYASHPRTRVLEDIGRDEPDAWYSLAARHLGLLAQCELQVVCSIFASRIGDESLGVHHDAWFGAIVQMEGAKVWRIGPGLLDEQAQQPTREITTQAGDVLLLPKGLPHVVMTPPEPGHSVHLAFAIHRDDPDRTRHTVTH